MGTGAPGYQSSGTAVSISGLRSENNNYTLDGMNNNETFFKSYGVQPSIDSIQEFKVQTNITSAEFGTGAGANVNVVTKSGSNQFHGDAFEFHRDNHLTTQDYFSQQANLAKPVFRQNQFGGVFGGPIHKNSTFFFASYRGRPIQPGAIGAFDRSDSGTAFGQHVVGFFRQPGSANFRPGDHDDSERRDDARSVCRKYYSDEPDRPGDDRLCQDIFARAEHRR